MIKSGLRKKGVPVTALLLALGALHLQSVPAHAYLSDDEQYQGGEVNLDYDGPGELPKHPGGGGTGGTDDPSTRRADPDDLSFNNPRTDVPVVPVDPPSRAAWIGILRLWLERFAALFFIVHR